MFPLPAINRASVSIQCSDDSEIVRASWPVLASLPLPHSNFPPLPSLSLSSPYSSPVLSPPLCSSLWCIPFAHKQIAGVVANSYDRKLPEDGLTLLGMVGLKDPCCPGVRTVVDACRRAGVAMKMIIGDNLHIARVIMLECSILKADQDLNEIVIEGQEFRSLITEQMMAIVDKISVMARSSPFDKLLMVKSLK
ncbi:hypothetical protein ACLOJK_027026 [Asimina triloba]